MCYRLGLSARRLESWESLTRLDRTGLARRNGAWRRLTTRQRRGAKRASRGERGASMAVAPTLYSQSDLSLCVYRCAACNRKYRGGAGGVRLGPPRLPSAEGRSGARPKKSASGRSSIISCALIMTPGTTRESDVLHAYEYLSEMSDQVSGTTSPCIVDDKAS